MSKVLVYSCVTGGHDCVTDSVLASISATEPQVSYVLYTDQLSARTKPQSYQSPGSPIQWELRPLLWQDPQCPRRTARWHKVNAHQLPGDYDYTIWIDGSQRIRALPLCQRILRSVPDDTQLAAFQHPLRSCIYDEALACIARKKDRPEVIQKHMERYLREGYPSAHGLVETGCVLRRSTEAVTRFNQLWWEQLAAGSFRDQLSFNYTVRRLGLPYAHLPGSGTKSVFFDFVRHPRK